MCDSLKQCAFKENTINFAVVMGVNGGHTGRTEIVFENSLRCCVNIFDRRPANAGKTELERITILPILRQLIHRLISNPNT